MSARKADPRSSANDITIHSRQTRLSLLGEDVWVRRDGIEFRSNTEFPTFTEMTVTLETPQNGTIHCNGVVVGCSGNRHIGYVVTMVFAGMSRQDQERLGGFVRSPRV